MHSSIRGAAAARALRASAAVLTTAGLAAVILAAPATARPPIGPVKNLVAEVTKPSANYSLAVDWSDLTNATSYKVTLSVVGGAVLTTDTVISSDWVATTSKPAGTSVKVTVVPFTSTRKGRPASVTKLLPDLTAPTGQFALDSHINTVVTVTQSAISDDVSPSDAIKREINWGDTGSTWINWPAADGNTINNSASPYAASPGGRYVPQVRLTDAAGNAAVVDVGAVLVADGMAPAGGFSAIHPTAMWARFTALTLEQTSLDDTCGGTCVGSPASAITRVINWGDGTTTTWPASAVVAKHVYQAAGTFKPSVTLTDEVAKSTVVALPAVTVKKDTTAPTVKLAAPKTGLRMVRSWKVLHGTAVDAGVGMGKVRLRVVEKRGSIWYAYLPAKNSWVKGGSTRLAALRLAGTARVSPWSSGRWQFRLVSLRKGTLVIQYSAVDRALNATTSKGRKQLLTKL